VSPTEGTPAAVRILRLTAGDEDVWVARTASGDAVLPSGLAGLLRLPLDEARAVVEGAAIGPTRDGSVLAPVDHQEVWAAGVTYERSRDERMAESTEASVYDRVYAAERPEVFFKATPWRVVADGDAVGIRADSTWDVPEGELALVLTSRGELFGYTVGNDMSSRSIEGENPLYLPQAKVYDASCALGPAIVPAWCVDGPFGIRLEISRGGAVVFEGATSTASLARGLGELGDWLGRALSFPAGAILLTGTGIVPDDSFTLRPDDVVVVAVDGIGRLSNPVKVVGA
jgi:2-dehydro-3-deoxy-D-arabinonate dehydratase